ncbi:Polyribonucleotide nucleotidyltransferase [Rosistilla oblonga]|uniref:Polyribonucleotide nucleotidyltransferase n=1 Tax=Rosistilla oblonga TaxID=2527990 RepID=A0A518IUR6_9BACT|nr:polyribonucleotide nucleotidyltransferase [Rosistilla oblonga]QDV15027.1 Polyribonucleotide nucleotidyltransferase [Rosistilla oblonga]QDV56825.1 Polyribonucleotide nucleotidyltransferase [Rosistilla oblonga]
MNKFRVEKKIGKNTLILESGQLAKQAAGCVTIQYGETVVLTAAATSAPRPGLDFFPLTCDYRERMAAAGKFPGGFLKREGRPTMKETLTARLTDRPIRPLWPKGYKEEVQVQSFVLSSDGQNDGDVLAMNGAGCALLISPLPFQGPVASVRVGKIDGELVAFPTVDDLDESELDLIVSGTQDAVTMIEGFAQEMPEDEMVDAILFAHGVIREIIALQQELYDLVKPEKIEYTPPEDDGLFDRLKSAYYQEFKSLKQTAGKQDRAEACKALKERAKAEIIPDPNAEGAVCPNRFSHEWHELDSLIVRELILAGTRPDGRDHASLRPIYCETDLLPRTHGSSLFQRGETQALITVTLGTKRDEQRVDGLHDEFSKKFMLDYNFPSFSVGECRPIRGPGRREIGHGALAERSIAPVLPDADTFPYTIRVISDILESNGSSSMASVCGATLGLMAAGVPITNPVAGISVGLVKENDKWVLITDILGDEDHFGDMDFKISGTQNGITGIQLDLKIWGISEDIIRATLKQSREARIEILRKMLTTISRPRREIAATAPRLLRTKIEPAKIGMLIGPGGKNIRGIQESTGTVVEVDDDGNVLVASDNLESAQEAMKLIEACTATVQIGKIYDGTVSSIKDFGAFVEILPGRDGLVHISELSSGFISAIDSVVKVGDPMKVLVIDIDEHDRVKLSRRQAIDELGIEDEMASAVEEGGEDRGGSRDGGDDDRPRSRGRRSGGGGGGGRGRGPRRD